MTTPDGLGGLRIIREVLQYTGKSHPSRWVWDWRLLLPSDRSKSPVRRTFDKFQPGMKSKDNPTHIYNTLIKQSPSVAQD